MIDDQCELLCLDLPVAEALRRRRLPEEAGAQAAAAAQALADPTRLMVAHALRHAGELCVCDLAWIAERPRNLVSHHLRVLRSAGLARSRRDGKLALYAMTDAGVRVLDVVLGAAAAVGAHPVETAR